MITMTSILLYEYFDDVEHVWRPDYIVDGDIAGCMAILNAKTFTSRNLKFFEGILIELETETTIKESKKKGK